MEKSLEEKRLAIVMTDPRILDSLLREGTKIITKDGKTIVCSTGILDDAIYCDAQYDFASDVFLFKYESDKFEPVKFDKEIPIFKTEYQVEMF